MSKSFQINVRLGLKRKINHRFKAGMRRVVNLTMSIAKARNRTPLKKKSRVSNKIIENSSSGTERVRTSKFLMPDKWPM